MTIPKLYTEKEFWSIPIEERVNITFDVGHTYNDVPIAKNVLEFYGQSVDLRLVDKKKSKAAWAARIEVKALFIGRLVYAYVISEKVRRFCKKLDLDLEEITSMRSTTDRCVNAIPDVVKKMSTSIDGDEHRIMREFCKYFIAAVTLSEEF